MITFLGLISLLGLGLGPFADTFSKQGQNDRSDTEEDQDDPPSSNTLDDAGTVDLLQTLHDADTSHSTDTGTVPQKAAQPDAAQNTPSQNTAAQNTAPQNAGKLNALQNTAETNTPQTPRILNGTDGDDVLSGKVANTWVESDQTRTVLNGGDGNDQLVLTDHVQAFGGKGADEFVVTTGYSEGNVIEDYDPETDTIKLDLSRSTEIPKVDVKDDDAGHAQIFVEGQKLAQVTGAAGQLSVDDIGFTGADFVTKGTPGDDVLSGTSGPDTLDGGDGNDTLNLGDADHAIGGTGADVFTTHDGVPQTIHINDFSPGEDVIVMTYNSYEGTWPAPNLSLETGEDEDLVISSDQGTTIRLVGLSDGVSLDDVRLVEAGRPA